MEKIKVIDLIYNSDVSDDDKIYKDGDEAEIEFNDNPIMYGSPEKKLKGNKKTGNLKVIDPGLSHFMIGDFISRKEYDDNKEYGLEVKNQN